jgi:hypothetical protein
MRETKSGSLIQVMAPHMMGNSVPKKSLPRCQILFKRSVAMTGASALMNILLICGCFWSPATRLG